MASKLSPAPVTAGRPSNKTRRPPAGPRSSPARGPGQRAWLVPLILFACAFGLYANTLRHDYAVDDNVFTTHNRYVQERFAGLPEILTQGSMKGFADQPLSLYRPLVLVSFVAEIAVWGNNPHVHHFFNVLLYAITAAALYVLLRRMLGGAAAPVALTASLLFVFHPLHTEVVASIKNRDEILAWLFGIFCLLQLLEHSRTQSRRALTLSTLCFLLALFSKENSAAFLPVAVLVLYFFTRKDIPAIGRTLLPHTAALALYLGLRAAVLGEVLFNAQQLLVINNTLVAARHSSERFATNFVILGKYLWLLVFPKNLSWDYSFRQIPIVGWSDWRALLSLALHVAMAVYALTGLKRRSPYAFAILFYFVMLAPVSNVLFLIGATMGERFLYVPSFGFCLALGLLLRRWLGATPSAPPLVRLRLWAVLGPILLLYAGRTVTRNLDWKDIETLFAAGLKVTPNSARAHGAMGNYKLALAEAAEGGPARLENFRIAAERFKRAVALFPDDPDYWYGLGASSAALGDTAAAFEAYRAALKRRAGHARALNNLGTLFFKRGVYDSAAVYFERSVEADSRFAEAVGNLGSIHHVRGDLRAAVQYYDRALTLDSTNRGTIANRRAAFLALGDTASANRYREPEAGRPSAEAPRER